MRYGPDHKAESRQRMLESVGALAKREGLEGTGLAALMAAAGVTTGAFYSQFKGKAELLQAVAQHELGKMLPVFEGGDAGTIAAFLRRYVSLDHVRHPEIGCPIPTLAAEIGRAGDATRASFEALAKRLHQGLAVATGNRDTAWTIMAQAAGAVLLARAMGSDETRLEVLNAAWSALAPLLALGEGEHSPVVEPQAGR